MFHAVEGGEQGRLEAFVSGVGFWRVQKIGRGFLIRGIGGEFGRDSTEGLERIGRDEDVDFVRGRVFQLSEDADGLEAQAIVSGYGGILPVIDYALLLVSGFGEVNAELVILAVVVRGGDARGSGSEDEQSGSEEKQARDGRFHFKKSDAEEGGKLQGQSDPGNIEHPRCSVEIIVLSRSDMRKLASHAVAGNPGMADAS